MSIDRCPGCDEVTVLLPLHGPKGGPLRCPLCVGAWNAEHGRKRRLGRIVVRAIRAFFNAGGSDKDLNKLRVTEHGLDVFGILFDDIDPLGYLEGSANNEREEIELTSELLADVLRLVHPDCHPPERADLAKRVTQQLLALQPFVFPAPTEPPLSDIVRAHEASAPAAQAPEKTKQPSYPCADCKSAVPYFYCDPCRAEWDKRQAAERERENAKQRKWYAQRKARRWSSKACERCGSTFKVSGGTGKGKRTDARFCSDRCRQKAHRKAVTDKTKLVPVL